MRHIDLFSGIGGFPLAASWVWPNHQVVAFCEQDQFCREVLRKHWPNVPIHDDIKTMEGHDYGSIDLISAGVPCQPASQAGKRRGKEDDRWLWPETMRSIGIIKPKWVILENVRGFISLEQGMAFENVLSDLEALGYETTTFILPACAVGAPHRRDRVWIIGCIPQKQPRAEQKRNAPYASCQLPYRCGNTWQGRRNEHSDSGGDDASDSDKQGLQRRSELEKSTKEGKPEKGDGQNAAGYSRDGWDEPWPEAAARLCPLDDGVSGGVAQPKGWRTNALKAAGNAIVPQVAFMIMQAIKDVENDRCDNHRAEILQEKYVD